MYRIAREYISGAYQAYLLIRSCAVMGLRQTAMDLLCFIPVDYDTKPDEMASATR
jgi:hypothetical protein